MAESSKKKIITESQVMRRNLLIAFVMMFLLLMFYVFNPGYYWAVKEIAIKNNLAIDTIQMDFDLMPDEFRNDYKLTLRIDDYKYIKQLELHTPDSAVILLPPLSAVDTTPEFNSLNDPEFMEYFLYPRLCISEDQKNTKKDLYAKVTYVAIVNGWGYDKLRYKAERKSSAAVLPIDKPNIDEADTTLSPPKPSKKENNNLKLNFNLNQH
jgi:hypothetical protein